MKIMLFLMILSTSLYSKTIEVECTTLAEPHVNGFELVAELKLNKAQDKVKGFGDIKLSKIGKNSQTFEIIDLYLEGDIISIEEGALIEKPITALFLKSQNSNAKLLRLNLDLPGFSSTITDEDWRIYRANCKQI